MCDERSRVLRTGRSGAPGHPGRCQDGGRRGIVVEARPTFVRGGRIPPGVWIPDHPGEPERDRGSGGAGLPVVAGGPGTDRRGGRVPPGRGDTGCGPGRGPGRGEGPVAAGRHRERRGQAHRRGRGPRCDHGRVPDERPPTTGGGLMQQWEYFVAPLLPHNPGDILNTFGEDGWELVDVVPQETPAGGVSLVAYLKRAKQ